MFSALYNGVNGIKTQSFGIDISANNIANINTNGFKYSNSEFKDIFYQSVSSQATNPAQKGFSSTYSSSKTIFEQGSIKTTDGEFDVALEGKGFFGVLGSDGNAYYTRNGAFLRDANNNLVDSFGNYILGTMNPNFTSMNFSDRVSGLMNTTTGWTVNNLSQDFNLNGANTQSILSVPKNLYLAPQITQNVQWSGNLSTQSQIEAVKAELDPNNFTLTNTIHTREAVLETENFDIQTDNEGKTVIRGKLSEGKEGDKVILTYLDKDGKEAVTEAVLDEFLNFTTQELDTGAQAVLNLAKRTWEETKTTVSGSVSQEQVFSVKAGESVFLELVDEAGVKKTVSANLDEDLNFITNELDLKGMDIQSLSIASAFVSTQQEKAVQDTLEAPIYNGDGSKSVLRVSLEQVLPRNGENLEYKAILGVYNANNELEGDLTEGNLVFNQNGALLSSSINSVANPNGGSINISFGMPYDEAVPGSGYAGVHISKDNKESSIISRADGLAEGFFKQYDIGLDGSIIATFDNGKNAVVGKLALYNFINEQGLASMGENIFAATGNSGVASFITGANGEIINTANFRSHALESSNVDLSTELTNLIVMQRAYDASSRSITTADQMLQKALDMKQ